MWMRPTGGLATVSVSGDFFLEPDEALEDIDAALVGMSTSAGVNQLAQAITGAPPDGAARHRIDVVRRISGGGAMFMEPGNCITYSLTVPASLVEGLSFQRSYAFLGRVSDRRAGRDRRRSTLCAAQRHRLRQGQDRQRRRGSSAARCCTA
jgi:hypothetical protein